MGSVAGEAAYFRGVRDELLRVHLAFFYPLDKAFVCVAPLTIVGVCIGCVAEGPVAGGQVLGSNAADRVFRLGAMAVQAAFGKSHRLGQGNRREQENTGENREETAEPLDGSHL